jgi:prepilin-type N-terminal cleavage/methylation domain-containing protein
LEAVVASRPAFAIDAVRRHAGLTLVELVVVMCIVAVIAAVLLNRLRFYQEAAEKAAMESTVGVLKSALQLRVAAMLVNGEERNIESLTRANPVNWLMEPPRGYRGEFRAPQPAVARGSWYFDAAKNELVYVPDLDDHLKADSTGSKRLRFRVELEFEHGEAVRRKSGAISRIRIVPVTEYTWF